ncbi:MAG: UDP-N-acetylglucosamine 1-carboxyvinyltransferase [Phototrophicaceae bacterium]
MDQFVIQGGQRLHGEVTPGGNKNAATKMIPACLLCDEPVTLHNVPDIVDVRVLLEVLEHLGASVNWLDETTLRVHAANIPTPEVHPIMAKTRAGIVLAGALLGRLGEASLPLPGGDVIGERRLDTLVNALIALGATVSHDGKRLRFKVENGLHGANILLQEASVTATENTVMAAVLAKGTTLIRNAAGEPHIQDLCNMLNTLGAKIDGIGSNQLVIEGVARLHGGEARIGADFMEVGSFVGVAAVTGSEITIRNADPHHLDMVALTFGRLGVAWEVRGQDLYVPAGQRMTIQTDFGGKMPTIKAQPWPAFPPDLMSIALVVATQSVGAVLFHDWMYESRFFFTDKLARMGARVTLCDPHRVLIQGPSSLHGGLTLASPDIRAGMALVLAALTANGETRIANIQQIERGYANIEAKLRGLGANIARVSVEPSAETV